MMRLPGCALALLAATSVGCSSESLVGLSAPAKGATDAVDFCEKLPALGEAPLLDGVPDLDALLEPLPRETWREPSNPLPEGLAAEYLVGWSPAGIYFYEQVTAPEVRPSPSELLWCGDAVHLFLDSDGVYVNAPSYDVPGTRQFIVPAPQGTTPNTTRAGQTDPTAAQLAPWASNQFGAFPRDGGYSVEALVSASDLGAPLQLTADARVAFDISVSFSGARSVPNPADAACEGLRLGDLAVALGDGSCVSPHCNVNAFCSPTLGALAAPARP
jgi:hypothetical protein